MDIAIITVTEYPSMRGRYKWAAKIGKKEYFGDASGYGPEAAAAEAVSRAIQYNKGSYTILAPKAVLDCIPADIRSIRA